MSKKIKVTLEMEPGKTYTIKPLGEKLAEETSEPAGATDASVTGTTTNFPNGIDADVDVDF